MKNFRQALRLYRGWCLAAAWLLLLAGGTRLRAAEPTPANDPVLSARYHVRGYVIEGKAELSTNLLYPLLAKYTGKKVSMADIVRAASDLQYEYGHQGWPTMDIIIAPQRISHGLVTFDVFQGAVAQILVAGTRYVVISNTVAAASPPSAAAAAPGATAELAAETNAVASKATTAKTGPKFNVHNYLVLGNTVLPPETIGRVLTNVAGAFGTNVGIDGIKAAATELQSAYRERGYVTVAVSLPPQKITNGVVKMQVTEGRLVDIYVKGNHYFSSNNVMRSLPGLHTNEILNGLTFQAELNRANASQDRQIYPVIDPGPEPGTSDLTLKVKDRFPLHAKTELNNQSSPGTPALRVNSSAVYDNLWQNESAIGIQYSFSPELYKSVLPDFAPTNHPNHSKWAPYDQPLVANYSGFYRIPLGNPEAIDDVIAAHPGNFGYDEATRKFNLPPPSGLSELTLFASRSTIDTGLATLSSSTLYSSNTSSLVQNTVQDELTINNDLGFRLSVPVRSMSDFHSGFSGGLDYKSYESTSYKTNVFILSQQEIKSGNGGSSFTNEVVSTENSGVPVTDNSIQYLPLTLRYDAALPDAWGMNVFGLGLNANLWYTGTKTNLQNISGSTQSSGHWVILSPSFERNFEFITNWQTKILVEGQWASEPLISNEQFGAGGVRSVPGYHEGQVFGDDGWLVGLKQQTPPHVVGYLGGHEPLTIQGAIHTEYADTYLQDPEGRPASTALWGTGFELDTALGTHWNGRFMFSIPLLKCSTSAAYDPFFNFSLTAQF